MFINLKIEVIKFILVLLWLLQVLDLFLVLWVQLLLGVSDLFWVKKLKIKLIKKLKNKLMKLITIKNKYYLILYFN